MKLRSDLAAACVEEQWVRYIKANVKEMILDVDHWEKVKFLQVDVRKFHASIKTMEGMYNIFLLSVFWTQRQQLIQR